MNKSQIRLALIGNSGVGKDTFANILKDSYHNLKITQLRLADPLYKIQKIIYKVCNKVIDDKIQDGILLNFLGQHFRKIRPSILIDILKLKLEQTSDIVICSDAREQDIAALKKMGFVIIKIIADEIITYKRRIKRKDLTIDPLNNYVTSVKSYPYDHLIENNDSIYLYQRRIFKLLKEIL